MIIGPQQFGGQPCCCVTDVLNDDFVRPSFCAIRLLHLLRQCLLLCLVIEELRRTLPRDGSPVIKSMSSMSIETSSSTHRYPPWVTSISCLMQLFTSRPLPKCGISNRFRILVLASPAAHYFGWKIGSPKGPIPTLSR
jgi:hypothetical protein